MMVALIVVAVVLAIVLFFIWLACDFERQTHIAQADTAVDGHPRYECTPGDTAGPDLAPPERPVRRTFCRGIS